MKYFSTFSGIGGFELGIKKATNNKWECIGYSEIDKHAIKTYTTHYPNHKNYGDITKINPNDLPDFDLFCGGFPCQSFSIAGKRLGFEDTRGTLFFDIARIIKTKKPRFIFLENVKGLLSHDNGRTFVTILATLDELGYNVEWEVLNSKNFGVPQNRERVFIIGHLRGTSSRQVFPIRQSGEGIDSSKRGKQLKVSPTIDTRVGDSTHYSPYVIKQDIIVDRVIGQVKVRKHIVNVEKLKQVLREHKLPNTLQEIADELNVKKTTVEHWFRQDNCFAIPEENIWFKLKEFLKIETDEFGKSITEFEIRDNKFDQSNRVYHKEGISPTITTLTGGHQHTAIDDGYSIRRLTPIECERLQGFPDNWTVGSDTQRYK